MCGCGCFYVWLFVDVVVCMRGCLYVWLFVCVVGRIVVFMLS